MASDYGLNFGFLRSGEEVRVAEGRYKTPAGSALLLGTLVDIDAATDGYLRAAPANTALVTGYSGLLLQELEWDRSIYDGPSGSNLLDSHQMGVAKPNRLAIITSGAGTKVWYRNTTGSTRADGRVIPTRTMANLAGVTVGTNLGWDGTQYVAVDATTTVGVLRVTEINAPSGYVAGVLLG